MKTRGLSIALPALILALAIGRIVAGDPFAKAAESEARSEAPPPVTDEARAVLDGLALGDRVAGLEVERIAGPEDHAIVVELGDGHRGMRAWITRAGARGDSAPRRTAGFDLFYGPPSPGRERVPDETAMEVLVELGHHVEAGTAEPDRSGL